MNLFPADFHFVDDVFIFRRLGADVVGLAVNSAGFVEASRWGGALNYESLDCSGQPYVEGSNTFTSRYPSVKDGIAYYTNTSFESRRLPSSLRLGVAQSACPSGTYTGRGELRTFIPPNGSCLAENPAYPHAPTNVAPAVVVDLSTLGLVPPFHVDGP